MIHIIKKNDIKEILSESCGKLNELYTGKEVDNNLSIVLGKNIGKTKPHFHSNNDEIYICVRGSLLVSLFDPETQESSKEFTLQQLKQTQQRFKLNIKVVKT